MRIRAMHWAFMIGLLLAACPAAAHAEVLFGFEQGLDGWERTGDAFDAQPTYGDNVEAARVLSLKIGGDYWKDVPYPIGHEGDYWIGTYEARPDASVPAGSIQGDGPQGTLTSPPFALSRRYLTFLVSGGWDPERLRVELLLRSDADGSYEVAPEFVETGHDSEIFRRVSWDVGALAGRMARLRIVDESSDPWGHINADDFRLDDEPPDAGSGAEHPLWGFADLHTHPMSHLGFGGKVLAGAPDGDIRTALGSCECVHSGAVFGSSCRSLLHGLVEAQIETLYTSQGLYSHPSEGYPDFKDWPNFTTVTHQQMWHEWIRRAYDGGLRTMVALAVNNAALAEVMGATGAVDDATSADIQIRAMKEFAKRHSDFMEIAYSPEQLRDIVLRGKLAVILGVEVDQIGNLGDLRVRADADAARSEVHRLYDEGVRYIFPIHLADNRFGGAAIFEPVFNVSNRFNAVQPLPPELGAAARGTAFSVEHDPDPLVTYRQERTLSPTLGQFVKGLLDFFEAMPILDFSHLFPIRTWGSVLEKRLDYRVFKNYFLSEDPAEEEYDRVSPGHRNTKGLTELGGIAMREMMRLGMMIDVDHMSELSLEGALEIAERVPGGYPLFSGHSGFRALGGDAEVSKTGETLARIRALGGMVGVRVGYEKGDGPGVSAAEVLERQGWPRTTSAEVENDCRGSSREFAQGYLYASELVGAVAFGTDANGLVAGPGPRFGDGARLRGNYCARQDNPVRYAGVKGGGDNEPLSQLRTGNRAWNVNTDGVPHYGLLPDLIQDLHNLGIQGQDLSPMFRGAENVARTWERAVGASSRVEKECD